MNENRVFDWRDRADRGARPLAAGCRRETVEPGLELIRLDLECPEPETPPRLTVEWRMPLVDMHFLWQPNGAFVRKIPADWCAPLNSDLATSAPVLLLGSQSGENRLLFAVSEAMRPVRFKAGVHEESCEVICSVELFSRPEAPISSYHAELRLDFRPLFYADAIRDAFAWFCRFPGIGGRRRSAGRLRAVLLLLVQLPPGALRAGAGA